MCDLYDFYEIKSVRLYEIYVIQSTFVGLHCGKMLFFKKDEGSFFGLSRK